MSDAYDWAKDDAYMLRKFNQGEQTKTPEEILLERIFGRPDEWTEEDRECHCGWQGLTAIVMAEDGWFWDCPDCGHDHSESVPTD